MGNLHRAMGPGAAVLDLPLDLQHPETTSIKAEIQICVVTTAQIILLYQSLRWVCFQRFATEAYYYYYYHYYTLVSSIICDQSQSQWFINKTIYIIVYQKYHALNFIGNILLTESGPNLDKKYVRFSDAALSHKVLRKINFVLKPFKKRLEQRVLKF